MRNLLFLLLTVAMFYSCGKDQIQNETTAIAAAEISFRNGEVEALTEGITIRNGMLQFRDAEHLLFVESELTRLYDEHDDAFVLAYDDVDIELLDEIEEEIGHVEFAPMIEFERLLNFESRRTAVERDLERWLANRELDFDNNPENIDGNSNALRTLLNTEGKAIVDGAVIDFNPKAPAGGACFDFQSASVIGFYNGNRVWEHSLQANANTFVSRVKCKVCNYKIKSNGNWKKKRTKIYVKAKGDVADRNCRGSFITTKSKEKKRKCLSVTASAGQFLGMFNEACGEMDLKDHQGQDSWICVGG